jgi:hypothetical protein
MMCKYIVSLLLWLVGPSGFAPGAVTAIHQASIDYLTTEEIEYVRDAQIIDARVKAFMKIAERRLLAAEDPQSPLLKRDEREWGALPAGTRADRLKHYHRAIEETIVNFEEAYDRNAKDEKILKALTFFCEHVGKHLPRLEALRSSTTDAATRQTLEQVLDDVKLAYDDARESEQQFKLEQEQRKKEKKKG